jgi:tetratricopeptide (TPR) repeat protein
VSVAGEEPYTVNDVRQILAELGADDPDRSVVAWHLADLLSDVGVADEDHGILAESAEVAESVIAELGKNAPERAGLMADLAITLWAWWEMTSDEAVLARCVDTLRSALEFADNPASGEAVIEVDDSTLRSDIATNLAGALAARFDLFGNPADRLDALALLREALECTNLTGEQRATIEADISVALGRSDVPERDIGRAVEFARRAVADGDPESPEHPMRLILLGNSLVALNAATRAAADLDDGIALLEEGLCGIGPEHKDFAGYCGNLMLAYRARYFQTGRLVDLRIASDLVATAVGALKPGSPDRCHVFTCAGTAVRELALQSGEPGGLVSAVSLFRTAVDAAVAGSAARSMAVIDLSATLRDAADADVSARRETLDEAVAVAESEIAVVPEDTGLRPAVLATAANAYRDRFRCFGDRGDLDSALGLAQEAVDGTKPGDPDKARRLTNLAVLMSDRYEEYLSLDDLDVAIDLYEQALAEDDPAYGRTEERWSNLAQALRERFGETGDVADLGHSVRLGKRILARVTPGSPSRPDFATTVANALAERFGATRRLADLDEALGYYRMAVDSSRDRTSLWAGYAMNLGLALAQRAVVGDDAGMMEEAVSWMEQSIGASPAGARDRAMRLSNAADVWRMRAEAGLDTRPSHSLEKAIALGREALGMVGADDPDRLQVMSNLALAMRLKAAGSDDRGLADAARALQRDATALPVARAHERFEQAARWAYWAQADGLADEAVEAYGQAAGLVPQTVWRGLSVPERLAVAADVAAVIGDGVVCAAEAGDFARSLAWADVAKSVVWAQLAATPGDAEEAGLTERERKAAVFGVFEGSLLVLRSSPGDDGSAVADSSGSEARPTSGDILARHRAARAMDRGEPPAVLDLGLYEAFAPEGWVVTLAHSTSVDRMVAVLAGPDDRREAIALGAGREEIRAWLGLHRSAQGRALVAPVAARRSFLDLLGSLWRHVAGPVVARIGADLPEGGAGQTRTAAPAVGRVWWQPVGDLAGLPWHAAGIYPRNARQAETWPPDDQRNMPSLAVSSYLRRVADLAKLSRREEVGPVRLLLAAVDRADGEECPAPSGDSAMIAAEAETVGRASEIPVTSLVGTGALIGRFLEALPGHQVLHLAAHGHRDRERPFESGVNLADGVLSLARLAGVGLADARLAVTLACDSGTEVETVPDEALNLVGALEAAGFRSVVGALTGVAGAAAIKVAEAVHRELGQADAEAVARVPSAVHGAVERIRRSSPEIMANPFYWAPIAHFQA